MASSDRPASLQRKFRIRILPSDERTDHCIRRTSPADVCRRSIFPDQPPCSRTLAAKKKAHALLHAPRLKKSLSQSELEGDVRAISQSDLEDIGRSCRQT